eukprot:GHVN01069954.1.p1 GENE.GHVN01069954.1~~GHVN01069954.1.p1  ORF type:complete len:382 (+),score=36.44 GHVN01069954.1:159-1304(+)
MEPQTKTTNVLPQLPLNPSLYQINIPMCMAELQAQTNTKTANLDNLPEVFFDHIAGTGVDFVYALGVWSVGDAGLHAARRVMQHSGLPTDDVHSSPFAIVDYSVRPTFGGNEALKRFREKLAIRGIRLIVDFVPNHVARDHTWSTTRPELIMKGTDNQFNSEKQNYFRCQQKEGGEEVFAHGRDPHFDGWDDTAQLDYFNSSLREEMTKILKMISSVADGVRCDMAMLVCSDVMMKTWGHRREQACGKIPDKPSEFWGDAIKSVRQVREEFIFMAEVYWEMERQLMDLGFDYCYDKSLYDKLEHCKINRHESYHCFGGPETDQRKLVRFLENHDEPRAATTFDGLDRHQAAALLCFTSPGLRFLHMGQTEGLKTYIPMQRC